MAKKKGNGQAKVATAERQASPPAQSPIQPAPSSHLSSGSQSISKQTADALAEAVPSTSFRRAITPEDTMAPVPSAAPSVPQQDADLSPSAAPAVPQDHKQVAADEALLPSEQSTQQVSHARAQAAVSVNLQAIVPPEIVEVPVQLAETAAQPVPQSIVEEQGQAEAIEVCVGDEVEILIENDAESTRDARKGTKGMKGKVVEDDGSNQPYKVKLPDGREEWFKKAWLQKGHAVLELPSKRTTSSEKVAASKASKMKSQVLVLLRNPDFQYRSLSAAGGTVLFGSLGGAFGCASGVVVGSAAGLVPALLTFGLSIPAGSAIGGFGGLCTGTLIGAACGGAGGLTIYQYRIQIKENAMLIKVKAEDAFDKAKQNVTCKLTLAREQVDARYRILRGQVTDLACNAKKRSLAAVDLAKSKSSEAYNFATTTRAGVTTGGAVAGAVVGGTTTGALGTVAGGAIGVPAAIFTFGLSIPMCAFVGGCVGTAAGGTAGAVGGGLAGYGGFTHHDALKARVQSFSSKVKHIKTQGVSKFADARESVRSAVTGSTGCSENVAVHAE